MSEENWWTRFKHHFYETIKRPHYTFNKVGKMRVHDIHDPEVMKTILRDIDTYQGPAFVRNTMEKLIGYSLINDDGDSWRNMHHVFAQSFSPKGVQERMTPVIIEETDAMIDRWLAKGEPVDIEHEMLDMTGKVITRIIFSTGISEADGRDIIETVAKTLREAREPTGLGKVMKKLGLPYDHAGFLPSVILRATGISNEYPASVPKEFETATKHIDDILYRVIQERRALPMQPNDVMGSLVNATGVDGKPLSDKEIRDQVLMLIVTGHETTAVGLTFALQEILRRPDVQKGIRDEFNAVTGGNRPLTGRDYNSLNFTQNAFKESLRLHSSVYMITREARKDADIGDIHIKKNDLIRMDLRLLHHSPDYWPEPEKYDPGRFAENGFPRAYMPFGGGPRTCLGMTLSLMEGALVLSKLFNRVNLDLKHELDGERYFFTTRPEGHLIAAIAPRPQ